MSIKSGDRARANKQANKRRLRRQESRVLRRQLTPAIIGLHSQPETVVETKP